MRRGDGFPPPVVKRATGDYEYNWLLDRVGDVILALLPFVANRLIPLRWHKVIVWGSTVLETLGDYFEGESKMARKETTLPTIEWVDVPIVEADKEPIRELAGDFERLLEMVASLVAEGNKVTIAHDTAEGSFKVIVFGTGVNKGMAMTSRGKRIATTLAVAGYRHYVLTGGVWRKKEASKADDWFG